MRSFGFPWIVAPLPLQEIASSTCAIAASFALAAIESHAQDSRDALFDTLRARAAVLARDPANRDAARTLHGSFRTLGGFHGAAAIEGNASLATRASQAAEFARWGADIPRDTPAERFALTDKAIARLDALIVEASAVNERDLLAQLEGDRVVALRNRERWQDALDELARLRAQGSSIRPYLREAEADALLALRKPEEARAIYAELAAADASNRDARIGRFYAEVECEDFDAAFLTADELDGCRCSPRRRAPMRASMRRPGNASFPSGNGPQPAA